MINNLQYIFGGDIGKEMKQVETSLTEVNWRVQQICDSKDIGVPTKSLYYLYPYLFRADFKLPEDEMLRLCTISVMCLDFCLFTDKLFDKQIQLSQRLYYHKLLIYQEFIKEVSDMKNSQVWHYYEGYFKEYVYGVTLEEERHVHAIKDYTWEEFLKISKGKQALTKLIPAIMGVRSGQETKIFQYENALGLFSAASQLYDDLRDWKEDLRLKRYSWMLTQILRENHLNEDCDELAVRKLLYSNNYEIAILDKANNLCEDAMLAVENNPVWVRYVRLLQIKMNRLLVDFMKIKGHPMESYFYGYRNFKKQSISFIIKHSWDFIYKQYKAGLTELKHWMFFTKGKEQKPVLEVLPADIFQRVCMLNLILELEAQGQGVRFEHVTEIIQEEVTHIITSESKKYEFGWVYCDGLYGNCSDLDTLSEIIRINNFLHNDILEEKIVKTVEKLKHINGNKMPFRTWIIEEGDADYGVISKEFHRGGEAEVNANLIAALCTTKEAYEKETIEKCLKWIYSLQNEEGYWESNWYVSRFYCGYVLSKTFHLLEDREVIDKYEQYLYTSQNKNGSWGDYVGNPLCTSFALLALMNMADKSQQIVKAIYSGLFYLIQTNHSGGYWYGCEFIKMGPGKQDASEQAYRYRSVTLTTMFCMYALCKSVLFLGVESDAEFEIQ